MAPTLAFTTRMSEHEFLVDAVAQFLQSEAWQTAVEDFLGQHYAAFMCAPLTERNTCAKKNQERAVVGYTTQQYDIFMQFKDLVEKMLEGVVNELGCRADDLVCALDSSVRGGNMTGERKFFMKTLLAFEVYEDFHDKISQYAAERQDVVPVAVIQSDTGEGSPNEAHAISEWQLQVAIASSLLEAHALGQLDDAELSFVPWAEAMLGVTHERSEYAGEDAVVCNAVGDDAKEAVASPPDERIKEMERTLVKERFKVDLLVAQRIADANTTLKKRMLQLTADEIETQETTGDENVAEDELAGLFSQLDVVRDRLRVVKSNCFAFKKVSQDAMDRMYLYLKEKVHNQEDLVAQENEIAQFIFSYVEPEDLVLIPQLLEWLLLESEGLSIQMQIQEHICPGTGDTTNVENSQSGDGYWTQAWDEHAEAFYYFHSASGDSVWDPPTCGFYDANQEYITPGETTTTEAATKDEYVEYWESNEEKGEEKDVTLNIQPAETAELEASTTALQAQIAGSSDFSGLDMVEMEAVLQRISREHHEERQRLELVFEVEKARQKEELRRRKEKKRRERAAKKKKKEGGMLELEESSQAKEGENGDQEENAKETNKGGDGAASVVPLPPPVKALPPIAQRPSATVQRAESKRDGETLSIPVPGRGRISMSHLLSDAHARRLLERDGTILSQPPSAQALLNPASIQYLTAALAKKHLPSTFGPRSARTAEIVLEEADEK